MDSEGDAFVPLDEGSVLAADRGGPRARRGGGRRLPPLVDRQPGPRAPRRRADRRATGRASPYTLSHRLNPIIREYRRASSTAIDASLKPLMQELPRTLERTSAKPGFAGPHLRRHLVRRRVAPRASRRDVRSTRSARGRRWRRLPPSPTPARRPERAERSRSTDLIVCDTGRHHLRRRAWSPAARSTTRPRRGSADAGSATSPASGRSTSSRSARAAARSSGSTRADCSASARKCRRGPGAGVLRPRRHAAHRSPMPRSCSAGSTPTTFSAGRLPLDADAARAVIEEASQRRSGWASSEAAYAALTIATENIVGAIREITIMQGIDPREVTIVAGGGASGLTIVPIARELGCRTRPRCRRPRARSRPAAPSSPTSSPSSRRAATRRPARSTASAVNATLRDVAARADDFLDGLAGLARAGDAQGLLGRGSLSRTGLGARRADPAAASSRTRTCARSRRRSTPRTSGSSPCASPVSTSNACSGRHGRPPCSRSRPVAPRELPAEPGDDASTETAYFQETGLRARSPVRRRIPVGGHAGRRPGDHPGADDDDRRLPGLGGRRHARSATTCSSSTTRHRDGSVERRARARPMSSFDPVTARGHRQPTRLDRARDGEHAAAHGSLGGSEHGTRLLLRADHGRQPPARLGRGPAGARDRDGVPRRGRHRPA